MNRIFLILMVYRYLVCSLEDDMRLFFVASRGLTATTWYRNALNSHADIFCSHGRDRPERGIETDELLKNPNYRLDRLEYEQWQREADIDAYIMDLITASNGETVIGNVHGYVLIELMDKLSSSTHADVVVANMVRHPITFTESYTSLVNHRIHDFPEKFKAEHNKCALVNEALFMSYGIDKDDLGLTGFVEACQALQKSVDELKMYPVYAIKMEEIVSDRKYFLDALSYLTKNIVEYDEEDIDKVYSSKRINSHQDKHKSFQANILAQNQSLDIWKQWAGKKKEIFLDMFNEDAIKLYSDYGYYLSFCSCV